MGKTNYQTANSFPLHFPRAPRFAQQRMAGSDYENAHEAYLDVILSPFERVVFLRGRLFCFDNIVDRTFEGTENDAQESFKSRHFGFTLVV